MAKRDVRLLLQKLCIELGFCLPADACERLVACTPATVLELTNAVFTEEGLDPVTADRQLYRQVKAAVAQAFLESVNRGSSDA